MKQTAILATFATLVLACGSADARPPVRVDLGSSGGLPYGMRVELLDRYGAPLDSAFSHGRRYVLGAHGERYTIRITNPSWRRVEVVVSVDGLDVIDGKAASLAKRGYVINPYSEVRIDGWRTSFRSVAAFRFGRVGDSYAARTGSARNVGVIGVAVFAERRPSPPPRPLIPRHRHYYDDDAGDAPRAGAAPQGESREKAPAKSAPSAKPAPSRDEATASGRARGAESEIARRGHRWRRAPEERPGLGTEFGERRGSQVQLTTFARLSSRPMGYAELRYNDMRGLARLGIFFDRYSHHRDDDLWLRETASPFPGFRGFAAPPPPRQYE
jgi:hypothetical protein